MNKQKLLNIGVTAIVSVGLIVYAIYLLAGLYSDVLITAQDRNVFMNGSQFFCERIVHPFGLFQYVGAFLTQFFYYPVVGALILIAIWTVSVVVGIKAFRLNGLWSALMILPAACLLAATLDLGYWVYCLTLPGYWFSQSVGFLCLMLMLLAAHTTPRKYRIVWYVVIGFALFPVFGWISYLFTACMALSQLEKDGKKWTFPSWVDVVGVVLTCAAPFVFQFLLYEALPEYEVKNAGFPIFHTSTNYSLRPSIPFYVLVGVTLFCSFGRVLPTLKKVPAMAGFVLVGAVAVFEVWSTIFKDDNYLYEMQMTQATMSDDWQEVISVAEKTKTPSRTMVMLKNIALLNTEQLGERSFELSNDGVEIYNPDTLNINIMHIASPVVYYNHGLVNYAIRWCMEFAIPYGFSPYYLKLLARSAEATGEKELSSRYTKRLNKTIFYSKWKPAPVSKIVKELRMAEPDYLDNDNNSVERYILSHFSKYHYFKSPHFCDLSLLYSVMLRDPNNFWLSLYDYLNAHKTKELPKQYEEAFVMFYDKARIELPHEVQITPTVFEQYKKFMNDGNSYAAMGMTEASVREAMRDEWGESYWWFNAFGRTAY